MSVTRGVLNIKKRFYNGINGELSFTPQNAGDYIVKAKADGDPLRTVKKKFTVIKEGTGRAVAWIPDEMKLDGSTAQEKYLKSSLANLRIKWNQAKVHALWKAVSEINKQYGVQMDPRFLLAIIIHEGTGSFNTSSDNKAADGQNGVESNYAKDLMKAHSLVFGKILGYIYYGDKFKKAVAKNQSKSGINRGGDIFQYCNWLTPIIRLDTKMVETGVYAGDGSWHVGVRAIYEKLSYKGAASNYSNYLSNVDTSVVKNIAKGIRLPSYSFVASKNAQDYRGHKNGNWTIIGKRK